MWFDAMYSEFWICYIVAAHNHFTYHGLCVCPLFPFPKLCIMTIVNADGEGVTQTLETQSVLVYCSLTLIQSSVPFHLLHSNAMC